MFPVPPRNRVQRSAFSSFGSGVLLMLGWTLTFLFLAVVAGYLGFFGLGGVAALLVKMAALVFAILVAVSSLVGLLRSEPPV